MPKESLQFIFINGKGSSGKDTQAEKLLELFGEKAVRISTGDIYRGAKDQKGEFAKYHAHIEPYIESVDSGHYLPDHLIVYLVKDVITEKAREGKGVFVFTGFPRTEGQLGLTGEILLDLEANYEVKADYIYYSLSDELSRGRAMGRWEKALAEGTTPRKDDNPATVEERLKVFKELTRPMLDHLKKEGRLVEIDASGTIEEIRQETSVRLSKERQ
jgi:adenylate kinase family enzyme